MQLWSQSTFFPTDEYMASRYVSHSNVLLPQAHLHDDEVSAQYRCFSWGWLHFRRARVRVYIWCSLCKIQARDRYNEPLSSALKNKRSWFSQWKVHCTAASWSRVCPLEIGDICKLSILRGCSQFIFPQVTLSWHLHVTPPVLSVIKYFPLQLPHKHSSVW